MTPANVDRGRPGRARRLALRTGAGVRAVALAVCVVFALTACAPTTTTAAITAQADAVQTAPGYEGAPVADAPTVPDVVLTDVDGEPVELRALMRERPTLLYVGYTHCPDICPVHLATLAQALRSSSVRAEDVNVVFVTADPRRDTAAVLRDYVATFDPTFIGLRGSPATIDETLVGLGLPATVIERGASDADGYTVGHPGQVIAFDTTGRARLQYPFGTRQSQWVEDLPKIARNDWPT